MMYINLTSGVLALIAGIVILKWPKALNVVVAIWLIVSGLLDIFQII